MSFAITKKHPKQVLPAAIILLIAVLAYVMENQINVFDYNKTAIVNGELWRIFTGHFFHTNQFHLLLNLAGLTLLTALHHKFYKPAEYFLLFIFSSLFISIALLLSSPLMHYVGLSGVLHGLFAWGALKDIGDNEKTGYLLFAGLWVKVIYEQTYGASKDIASLINASVAIDAHLWGALAGTIYFFLYFLLKRGKPSQQ